jgi:hypothetical protein
MGLPAWRSVLSSRERLGLRRSSKRVILRNGETVR